MTRQWKTKPVTPGGRLVTRAQLHAALQNAADKIVSHIAGALGQLEQHTEARLARIEKELGLAPMPLGPELVNDVPADEPAPTPPTLEPVA